MRLNQTMHCKEKEHLEEENTRLALQPFPTNRKKGKKSKTIVITI